MPTTCPICNLSDQQSSSGNTFEVTCDRCGKYKITYHAKQDFAAIPADARPAISEWVGSQNRLGSVPTIRTDAIPTLLALPRLEFMERARRLLLFVAERSSMLGKQVNVLLAPEVGALLQTFLKVEIGYIAEFLQNQGWMRFQSTTGEAYLTGSGFIQADEWRRSQALSMQGFVAMWFHPDMESAWASGFAKAVSDAGYKPQRIDKKEHINKICDEIVAEIRRSRFVVADLTGHRGGVYFEAGFAMGLRLPVIWTCREDHLKGLHFDIRQYNCIDWKDVAELAERLEARISALLGDGPLRGQA